MISLKGIISSGFDGNVPSILSYSLCPSIYGQELVKAGLCLALAGGVTNQNRRGDIHILIVGDPGLGKSQLLRSILKLNNRSVYVCGNTTTGSGLTVTMAKDKVFLSRRQTTCK